MGKSLNCQWMAFAWIWQQIAKQIYFLTSISESWLLRSNQNCKADSSPERTIPPTLTSRSKTIVEKKLGGLPATQDWLERSRQKVQKSETKMQENLYKAERRGTVSDKMVLQLLHLGLDQTRQSRCDQIVFRGFSDLKTGMFQGGSEQCETIRIAAMAAIKTISVYSRCTKSHFHPAVSWAIFWLWLTYYWWGAS